MRNLILSVLALLVCTQLALAQEIPGRWPAEKATQYMADHPWLVGCNFINSTAINQLEMFQADSFDTATIDRELGYAEGIGFNCIRVFLHNLLWEQDSKGFLERLDKFTELADKHHIQIMFVIFDGCWDPHPQLGTQRGPAPFTHNSGWAAAPGYMYLRDPKTFDSLKPYVQGVISHFKDDKRVVMWDLYNEADSDGKANGRVELTPEQKVSRPMELMRKEYAWAREINPIQPLTTCVWRDGWAPGKTTPFNKQCIENSDVISFHNYSPLDGIRGGVEDLKKYNRPLFCSEYMCRPQGSTFPAILPFLKKERIGAINWGMVSGKTNTIYPWDSWEKKYHAEPNPWFHDIFRPDGTPFSQEEIAVIKQQTGAQ